MNHDEFSICKGIGQNSEIKLSDFKKESNHP